MVSLYIFTYIQLSCWKRTNAPTKHTLLPCNFRCKLWCKLFTGHCTQKNTTFIKSSCLRVIFNILQTNRKSRANISIGIYFRSIVFLYRSTIIPLYTYISYLYSLRLNYVCNPLGGAGIFIQLCVKYNHSKLALR